MKWTLALLLAGPNIALARPAKEPPHYRFEVSVPTESRSGPAWRWRCADALRKARDENSGVLGTGWINDGALVDPMFHGEGVYYLKGVHPDAHFYIDLLLTKGEPAQAWQEEYSEGAGALRNTHTLVTSEGTLRLRAIYWQKKDRRVAPFFALFQPVVDACYRSSASSQK